MNATSPTAERRSHEEVSLTSKASPGRSQHVLRRRVRHYGQLHLTGDWERNARWWSSTIRKGPRLSQPKQLSKHRRTQQAVVIGAGPRNHGGRRALAGGRHQVDSSEPIHLAGGGRNQTGRGREAVPGGRGQEGGSRRGATGGARRVRGSTHAW